MTTTPGYTVDALLQAIDWWVDLKPQVNRFMPNFRESARSTVLARAAELSSQNAVEQYPCTDCKTPSACKVYESCLAQLTAERASPAKDGGEQDVQMSDHCKISGCVHLAFGCPAWPDGADPFSVTSQMRPQSAEQGWQPIETAPDGEYILCAFKDNVESLQWDAKFYAEVGDLPTHWMPLPQPPQGEG
jgi:hypothetical protein